jgi:hypothetical protein
MSKQFTDTARSIIEHGLINKGILKPARVWHIDTTTGKRTLLEDNTEMYRNAQKRGSLNGLSPALSHTPHQE